MTEIIIPIITGIVCLAVGVVIGFLYRKSVAEKAIGDAETEATRIINEAIKAGETKKRESVLEAKDEIHRQRVEADRELKERRNETQQLERRLIQREEALDKKSRHPRPQERRAEPSSGIRTEEGERAPAHQGRAGRKARTDREHDARRSTRNARQLDRGRGAA